MKYELSLAHAKYIAGTPLSDTELRAWHRDLGLTLKKLFNMGYTGEPLYERLSLCLKDAYHMIQSRKQAGKWKPIRRRVDKIK